MTKTNRNSIIKYVQYNSTGSAGPDTCFVVDLYEDGKLLESRQLLGKSRYYAEDVAENWRNGIIQVENK